MRSSAAATSSWSRARAAARWAISREQHGTGVPALRHLLELGDDLVGPLEVPQRVVGRGQAEAGVRALRPHVIEVDEGLGHVVDEAVHRSVEEPAEGPGLRQVAA